MLNFLTNRIDPHIRISEIHTYFFTFAHQKSAHHFLNKDTVPGVSFPEFLGDAEFFALKYPVEIGDVIEAAFVSDLGYCNG